MTDALPTLDGALLVPRRQPLAHVRFCHVYSGQCDVAPDRRAPGRSAADLLAEVREVNRAVNRAIRPQDDTPGEDRWDINVPAGDCEDYALQKRADLLARGWPSNAMRIAIVRTRDGRHHGVLIVRIARTDYVLDNLRAGVVPLSRAGYLLLMVQDDDDPRVWFDAVPQRRQVHG
jgi:predicted transglutaminase-like cysteine proteinase